MSVALTVATRPVATIATCPIGLPLALRDVRVAFADAGRVPGVVLDIPKMEIKAGEQVAICGPSGSGKTTLLNILAGIQRPERGTVHWGAVELASMSEQAADRWRRHTLGLVFQQFHLFSGLSALANVLLPLRFDRYLASAVNVAWARELLGSVQVDPDSPVERLSRGEMQRVAIARALVRRPAVVLADEPTASLDRGTATMVAELLFRLCREQCATLVLVTHDLQLAAGLDRQFELATGGLRGAASFQGSGS